MDDGILVGSRYGVGIIAEKELCAVVVVTLRDV